MFVYRLPLVVIFRMADPVRPRDRLCGLIRLETQIPLLMLFRNTKGVFTDVTKESGLGGHNEFSTSAAWVDVDRDGNLDLVVGNYVQWTTQTDLFCTLDGTNKSYCTPESYKGASARFWRNRPDEGTLSRSAGNAFH